MARFWRSQAHLRPWTAAALAYLVAVQLLLTGIAASHLGLASDPLSGNVFITCLGHSIGPDADQGGSGQRPVDQTPCVFCNMAGGTCAIIPVVHNASVITTYLDILVVGDDQVVEYDSPTGQYPRGPPATDFAAG